MRKKKSIYFILLGFLFAAYIVVEIFKPKKIDWSLDFSGTKKIPYGCFVFKQLLPEAKPGLTLRINKVSLYTALGDTNQRSSSLLIITEDFNPDKTDMKSLLRYAKKGNKVLISAISFGQLFADTLGFATNIDFSSPKNFQKPIGLNFVNPRLRSPENYEFKGINPVYFSSFDTLRTTVIGRDSNDKTNFICVNIGKGSLYLSTKPEVFTNYHILYSTHDYAIKALSYLDSKSLIWDEYYKPKPLLIENQSPLRYILSQESLRYAYFLLLFTIALFMLFESKRRQRIIPILSKPVNSSVEFVETIGRLYLKQKDNADLAKKKIQHFFDFIAASYYLKADESSTKFRKQFAEKAAVSLEKSNLIFDEIIRIKNTEALSDKDLLKFVKLIDQIQYRTVLNS